MSEFLQREQERDFLLSAVLSLEALAKGGKLTNENVLSVTSHVLSRIRPGNPEGVDISQKGEES